MPEENPSHAKDRSPAIERYFSNLASQFEKAFVEASSARAIGIDPFDGVEIAPAKDVAARVEGLVGPAGVAARIREISIQQGGREKTCLALCKEIMDGAFDDAAAPRSTQQRIEQAIRSALALFTEGVVSAPIEGITRAELRKNFDGSSYLAVYFSGPIRGAGGTGQAFTVVLGDICRKMAGISDYRPTDTEVERYVEEIALYARRTRAGQYVPTEDEIRHIARSCPVCIAGEPTEDYEISKTKNIPSIETNRVRSGVCLVIGEGLCLKAAKVLKIAKKAGLNWEWIERMIKVAKTDANRKVEIAPSEKYMDELVAGRPIFSYPMRQGGFRLRYGRTRLTGIASKAIHPATMEILRQFPAIGTQIKLERPGKGCIVTPCEHIEGPTVRLKNGDVLRVESAQQAADLAGEVGQVLFLGDILVNYGDFLKANHPLVPSPWCEEWYGKMLESKGGPPRTIAELALIGIKESLDYAKKGIAPIAPRHTYNYSDLSAEDILSLATWLAAGRVAYEWFDFSGFSIANDPDKKVLLERLGVPHLLHEGKMVIEGEWALALLESLGLLSERRLTGEKIRDAAQKKFTDALELVNHLASFGIRRKATVYVGASMGRPEKAKERKMQPPVHALFPIGEYGGKTRDIVKAKKVLMEKTVSTAELEMSCKACPKCKRRGFQRLCQFCGERTVQVFSCEKCGKETGGGNCACGGSARQYSKQVTDIAAALQSASDRVNYHPDELKGVIGLVSESKVPEPLEKGILRQKHSAYVFRDGTCRFDATEVPITHFYPREIGVGVEQLAKLGYGKDAHGNPLESDGQLVEIFPQDVIINEYGGDYLCKVASFVDDELAFIYGRKKFYGASSRSDLVGRQAIAIAPHTSAGIVVRIIGYTPVRGLLCHPYVHCACRRNCDGDELCLILMMDGLLNFSKKFLPQTRGGQMDAPLVLTTVLDPREVDDEVHAMDACWEYPLSFYEETRDFPNPSEAKVDTVSARLGTPAQFEGIGFTHECTIQGPVESRYVQLEDMAKKVEDELALMQTLRSVDSRDAAERIILSHFVPDLYGNLRKFTRQSFRCVACNAKYRRVPLVGKCRRCGGKLLLTISKGGIEKYLDLSLSMVDRYGLPAYLRQRLELLRKEIASIFEDEKERQYSLASFV
jgi:DNA polymerase II large subunit